MKNDWLNKEFSFGFTLTGKSLFILAAAILAGALVIAYAISASHPPAQVQNQPIGPILQEVEGTPQLRNNISPSLPVVAGKWTFVVEPDNTSAQVIIDQNGTAFTGRGSDARGKFQILNGRLIAPGQISFQQSYEQLYVAHGAPSGRTEFSAQVYSPDRNGLLRTANGAWRRAGIPGISGGFFHRFKGPAEGTWIGTQTLQPQIAHNPFDNRSPAPLEPQPPSRAMPLRDVFMYVAAGLLALGTLIVCISLRFFGPSGLVNIWEKQKYIPSQFRSLHGKMVRELGKPLKPGSVPLGARVEWRPWAFWHAKNLSIPAEMRDKNPHILILGSSDKGKTRLMASMVVHDIKAEDRAVVVIDSDGELSDLVIDWMAAQHNAADYADRVLVIDPTRASGSLAYNPLEMPADGDLQAAASAIVHGFKAIYTEPPGSQSQWNAQTANILRNTALLLMANGRTLVDLPSLLQDNDFRDIMLDAIERKKHEKTEYTTICENWNQYKKLARTDQWITWVEPILNRVGPMLSDGRIRPILTKPVSDLNLKEIIRQRKVLIIKVSRGELDQNANLLGSLIITGLQQAAVSLCRERQSDERRVALYLDEMDNFLEKDTLVNITSETARYQIGLCTSLKSLQHLPDDFKNQIIISMGTMCIFALAKKDGDLLGPQMFRVDGRKLKHQTMQNFFNRVNTEMKFELITDEEKLNIDRVVGQNEQTFFCYRVGTVAGVFQLRALDFKDLPDHKINKRLVEKMHVIADSFASKNESKQDAAGE